MLKITDILKITLYLTVEGEYPHQGCPEIELVKNAIEASGELEELKSMPLNISLRSSPKDNSNGNRLSQMPANQA